MYVYTAWPLDEYIIGNSDANKGIKQVCEELQTRGTSKHNNAECITASYVTLEIKHWKWSQAWLHYITTAPTSATITSQSSPRFVL